MQRCDIRFLQCGYCRHPEAITQRGAAWRAAVFPALVGLFVHPQQGLILFDTGYDAAFMTATQTFPERFYRWLTPPTLGISAAQQVRDLGYDPGDVAWVILSHFHGDHMAGLHTFPRAKIACSRHGLAAARHGSALSAVTGGVLRGLIPHDIDERVHCFEDGPLADLPAAFQPFTEGVDLFGDGSLLAIELPGHCLGHWGLAARGLDDRLHFLAADAAWSSAAIRLNRPPPRTTTAFLGRTEPYRQTLEKLHRMQSSAPEILITPSHCRERAAQIRADSPQ